MAKKKVGRPATGQSPARQLGRVSDDQWRELQAAAKRSGKSFTKWAVTILLRAAKRG